MLNSLQLQPYYRDLWGFWDSHILPMLAPLDHNSCYRPKFYNAPDVNLQNMEPGDYQKYNLTITPGSLIWGFLQNANELPTFEGNGNSPIFTAQIKDVSTGHVWFDTPVSNFFLTNPNETYPHLFAVPYPVVGNGMFNVQIWCNSQNVDTTRCYLTFGVAEVIPCQ